MIPTSYCRMPVSVDGAVTGAARPGRHSRRGARTTARFAALTRRLIPSALALSLAALWSAPASACKCKLPTVEEAKEGAVAIFEGRVLKVEDEAAAEGGPPPGKRITFSVVRTWKALDNQEQVTLRTNESSAACGYTFEPNTSYLVYAGGSLDALSASACSRTRSMSEAGEDLGPLGAGITPVKVEPAAADAGANAPPPATKKSGGCATSGSAKASVSSASMWLMGPSAIGFAVRRRRRRDARI